jgi:hypothetical protein
MFLSVLNRSIEDSWKLIPKDCPSPKYSAYNTDRKYIPVITLHDCVPLKLDYIKILSNKLIIIKFNYYYYYYVH